MMTAVEEDGAQTAPVPEVVTRPPRGRSLWVVFGSLFVLAGLGWGTLNVVELLAHEERTERFTVPAADISRLRVDNATGSVTIVGTDADEISVEAEVSDGLRRTGFSHEVVDATLELRGSCPLFGSMWCGVTYRIEVPRHLDVDVDGNNGRVEVSNIDGDVHVDTSNGSVELSGIAGALAISGDNGSITGAGLSSTVADVETDNGRVELTFTEPPDHVEADGNNGSIEIALPVIDVGYDVEASTSNGGETLDILNNPESPHRVRLQTDNGSITVRGAG